MSAGEGVGTPASGVNGEGSEAGHHREMHAGRCHLAAVPDTLWHLVKCFFCMLAFPGQHRECRLPGSALGHVSLSTHFLGDFIRSLDGDGQ